MYTQNNNSSMKTVVETFVIEETQDLIYDNEKLDQWNQHVADLGLVGQTKIVKKDKSPIPFLHMKKSLIRTFEELCPRRVKIEEYDKTPIPVELLDLAALSNREGYFDKMEVWYDDETPDPCVIGLAKNASYDSKYPTWDNGFDKYLIGRWADVKQPLDELVERAKVLFTKREKSRIQQEIRNYNRRLEDLDNEAALRFGFGTPDPGSYLPF